MTKILHLTLKKKWFDMIKSGLKTEEYREIKDYWVRRLISLKEDMEYCSLDEFINDLNNPYYKHHGPEDCMRYFNAELKQFTVVEFRNGYRKDRPTITMKLKLISIGTGCTRQGAEKDKVYFVIHLGKVLKG